MSFRLRKKKTILESTENGNKEKSKICQFDLSLIKPKYKDLPDDSQCDPQELTCKSCSFQADSLFNLFQHNAQCKKLMKIYECSLCGKQCKKKRDMKQHMIVHLDERPYSCDICYFTFKRQFQLTKHKEVVHNVKANKQICRICGWVGKSKKSLLVHRKECTSNIFQCDICKKMFGAKSSLEYHLKSHSSDRPFPCDICDARFKYKRNAHKHILYVHQGHRPEKKKKAENPEKIPLCQCEICGKSFYSRFGYSSHIRKIHGDGKPRCPICDKQVSCKKGLTIHLNTHTGEKPYCCEICGRSFTTKDYMKIHARIHTGESPYKCHICPKSFKQKGSLNGHYRTNHPGSKPVNSSFKTEST